MTRHASYCNLTVGSFCQKGHVSKELLETIKTAKSKSIKRGHGIPDVFLFSVPVDSVVECFGDKDVVSRKLEWLHVETTLVLQKRPSHAIDVTEYKCIYSISRLRLSYIVCIVINSKE